VAAVEGPVTFHSFPPEVSKSNIVCANQKPQIYSPNAFTPNGDGLNDKFLPALAFHDLKAFRMEIYNRWGERIYETEDSVDGGWDGTSHGKVAPDGAYVYKVKYKSSDGRDFEEEGTVTLQR
jgi:gliding motility-associated-like protein